MSGALIVAGITLVAIVIGLAVVENPLATGEPVGGPFLNLILLGYGLPAVLAIVLALVARRTRPIAYRAVSAAVSVALALAYLTLEVVRLYHGPVLTAGPVTDPEQYTFSAVWLGFGVVLLLAGLLLELQAGPAGVGRGDHAHHRQGVPGRHVRPDRDLARAVLHRARAGAGRYRLSLPAPAVPAAAGWRKPGAARCRPLTRAESKAGALCGGMGRMPAYSLIELRIVAESRTRGGGSGDVSAISSRGLRRTKSQ